MAGRDEIAFFRFMEARRLVGNEEKRKWGVTHSFFGYDVYRVLRGKEIVKDRGAFQVSDEDYPEYKRLYLAALREGAYLMSWRGRESSLCCAWIST